MVVLSGAAGSGGTADTLEPLLTREEDIAAVPSQVGAYEASLLELVQDGAGLLEVELELPLKEGHRDAVAFKEELCRLQEELFCCPVGLRLGLQDDLRLLFGLVITQVEQVALLL